MVENTLKSWSFTLWKHYQECPFRVRLKYIEREPEPPEDPKYDAHRNRGIKAHDDLQDTINVGAPIPQIAKPFTEIIEGYIELGAVAEGDEHFNNKWEPVSERNWLIVKKDVKIVVPGEFVLTCDWKTGRRHGNEYNHHKQMELYAVTDYIKHPGLPEYIVELQYLDQKLTHDHTFLPHELEQKWGQWDRDAEQIFSDTLFRPKPSTHVCRYCPYNKSRGTGVCPVAAL